MSTISQHNPAGKTSTYLAAGQHPGVSHTRRTNDRKVQDKQRAKHPAGTDTTRLRLTHIQQRQFVRPTYALPHNLRATPSTSACHSACHHCRACHRRPTARALGMQHTQMMLHGDQHDVRIFQAKMSFAFGCIQRALTFGIRIQRIVAVRMLIIGNRPSSQRRLIGNVSMIVILPAR